MNPVRLYLFAPALLLLLGTPPVQAYNLASGVTHPCHEKLTIESAQILLEELTRRGQAVPLPTDDLWQRVATEVLSVLPPEDDPGPQRPEARFLALSLLLGVRNPDTGGHSVASLVGLRRSHADPTPESQYQHCLRSEDDDGPFADRQVLEAAMALLSSRLRAAATALISPATLQLQPYSVYLEFSGQVQIEVYQPAFLLGEALHIVQDSFSHAIRTDDGREVLGVLNFVEAADGSLEETRDGLAHSKAMDRCEDEALADLVFLAQEMTLAAASAMISTSRGDDNALLKGLTRCEPSATADPTCGWFSYPLSCESALELTGSLAGTCCSSEEGYCQTRWLPIAKTSPTLALSQSVFGCAWEPPAAVLSDRLCAFLSVLLCALAGVRRRWSRALAALGSVTALQLTGTQAQAQVQAPTTATATSTATDGGRPASSKASATSMTLYGALEVHGSLFAGQAERGLPDVTFGPHLRVGVRPRKADALSLGYFALIEQSSWLATETETSVKAGVLNLGLGAELMYFDALRGSLACGPSVLLSDTIAHAAPQVGMFVDFRPVGLRLPIGKGFLITLDPLTATWVAPALTSPMVATLHYRIVLGLEWLPR